MTGECSVHGCHCPGLCDEELDHFTEQARQLPFFAVEKGPSLLVVGPDRVGKTTLVRHLSRLTGIPSFKCPSEKQIFKDGGRSSLAFDYTLTHFMHQTGYRFISDRAYPCEWVYSRVFKRETDDRLLEMIDAAHANLNTKILYVHSMEEPQEEDDLVPKEMYWDVSLQYQSFAGWTGCDVTTVDTSRMLQAYRDGGDISRAVAEEVLERLGWV
jgi:hypothetical protein